MIVPAILRRVDEDIVRSGLMYCELQLEMGEDSSLDTADFLSSAFILVGSKLRGILGSSNVSDFGWRFVADTTPHLLVAVRALLMLSYIYAFIKYADQHKQGCDSLEWFTMAIAILILLFIITSIHQA